MAPDALMEYCFFAAFKLTCTDAELPLTCDKFYAQHMQPARPAGQPQLDAKKTSYKQIGKFIKHMHKQKYCNLRDVKGTITILSVDRTCTAFVNFELSSTATHKQAVKEDEAAAASGARGEDEVVALRTKPPVVTEMWQPNSYTKPLFEAVGLKDKNATYTLPEVHGVLEKYIANLVSSGGKPPLPPPLPGPAAATDEVMGFLRYSGLSAVAASKAANSLAVEGFDSLQSLRAGSLESWELSNLGLEETDAAHVVDALAGKAPAAVRSWLVDTVGVDGAIADAVATALAADGFDSLAALCTGALTSAGLQSYGVDADGVPMITAALAKLKAEETGEAATGSVDDAVTASSSGLQDIDPEAVPLDELLLNSLVKLAGGAKKGTTFATHMPLGELKAAMKERMTAFHRVEVEGEAPSIRKGGLKLINIEMKRAAGHNKTHVAGLESFCISPDAVANALKVKLGCTTAVLKLPGNNVKDQEVLLQGHCVQEVCDYLRDVYCIDKQWIELKLKDSKRSNT